MAAVEEFELVDDAAATPEEVRTGRRRRSRPAPWAAVAVALVIGGAAAATPVPVVHGRGDGLDIGLLDLDLSAPPTIAWQTGALRHPGILDAGNGHAVLVAGDDGTSRTFVGIDLAEGSEIWRHVDDTGTCQDAAPVVCVEAPGSAAATIVVIDGSDGSRHELGYPGALGAATAGDDLVVVEATGTSVEEVVLVEPDSSERWRAEVDAAQTQSDLVWAPLRVGDGVVLLEMPGVALDLDDGTVTTVPWFNHDGFHVEQLGDELVVSSPDGRVTIDASESVLWVDDDVGGPVRLEQEAGDLVVAATLRADGTELWRSSNGLCYAMARLQGAVVMECWGTSDAGVFGVDELTGERLWKQSGAGWPVVASASTIVLMDYSLERLVAVDPDDGSTLWSFEVPGSDLTGSLTPLPDGVLISTETAVLKLVWA